MGCVHMQARVKLRLEAEMISLKRYLDSGESSRGQEAMGERDLLAVAIDVYGAALMEMGNCSLAACPGMGDGLKQELAGVRAGLSTAMDRAALVSTDVTVREQLSAWGIGTAKHYHEKAREVKALLLAVAGTAESVSARDERCAGQMNAVTERLRAIASLDDLTQIRTSIEMSAAELKSSIDRMTAEGKAVLDQMREQVMVYQAKLEEAERIAARDALTGLSSRIYVEGQIERRIGADAAFCVALIDIDGFKRVNDEHGHVTGDDLLKQFGAELRSACRASDVIGRWGGDEFLLLFDCGLEEAEAQTERLRKWICGDYTVRGKGGELKIRVSASIGLTVRQAGEQMKDLVERADAVMYGEKANAPARRAETKQLKPSR
jgi:diguanylate cyclase (GGDEF)-like protein